MALYSIPKNIKSDKKFPVLFPNEVKDLNNLSSLSEQVEGLTTLLEMPSDELPKRKAAVEELLEHLRRFYPASSLLMYGPSVNSFAIKGCDIDLLFTPFPNYCSSDREVDKKEEVTVPDPASVLSGEVSKAVLAKFSETGHLKFIRSVLKNEKIGKRCNLVIVQKRHFLRVVLKNSDFTCSISASNKLVAAKSELLQFYSRLDERVKPLVICLQLWARSLGFMKMSYSSSYSFTSLVIFFLQSINPPVLPSVQRLTELAGSSRVVDGWQTAFCTDLRRVPKSKNNLSVGELLIQFFDFYFQFDFLQNIVSPHSGRALPIKDIQNSMDERMTDFNIKPMNIQDLFALSSNVSAIDKLTLFKLALLSAHRMLKGNDKMKLPAFVNPDAYQYVLDTHYCRYFSGKPNFCFIHLDNSTIQKFGKLQMWYDKVSEAVYDLLQYGLLMECEVIDKTNGTMRKGRLSSASLNGNSKDGGSIYDNNYASMHPSKGDKNAKNSTPYDLQLLISIQCVMYLKTYMGRKSVNVATLDSHDCLDVNADSVLGIEHCISKFVLDKNPLLKSSVPIMVFDCECYRHTNPILTDIIVMLKPYKVSNEFKQVSLFLSAYLPTVVKQILIST